MGKKEKELSNEIMLWNGKLKKSNYLISASYKSTLLENKLMALALMNVKKIDGSLKSTMNATYIKSMLKISPRSGGFYKNLYNTSLAMSKRQMILQNDKKEFGIINIITDAWYKDGEFTVEWNSKMEPYIYNLSKNFTKFSILTMATFKSNYSFRLYELLLSQAYNPKDSESDSNVFFIQFELAELKMKLGVIDSNDIDVQRALVKKAGATDIDYKSAEKAAKNKIFTTWTEFNRSCLKVAVNEINNNPDSDIHVQYETIKAGKGAKVVGVVFTVVKKIPEDSLPIYENEEISNCLKEIKQVLSEKLPEDDLEKIAEVAGYDIEKIKTAYQVMKSSGKKIENVTGFMIKAIQDGYKEPVTYSSKKKNSFTNIHQRDYDYDELERAFLQMQMKFD